MPRPCALLFVAPWEASRAVARVPAEPNARVTVCFVESLAMGARLPWHRQKLVLVLSAMRHFAGELMAKGYQVDYRRADGYAAGGREAARAHGTATACRRESSRRCARTPSGSAGPCGTTRRTSRPRWPPTRS